MATPRKPPTAPAEEPSADAPATETQAASQPAPEELLEQARTGLLTVITNAVSPETDHGVDVVLARQAADVYQILFGESR